MDHILAEGIPVVSEMTPDAPLPAPRRVREEKLDPARHIIVEGRVIRAPLDDYGTPRIRERRLDIDGVNYEHTHEEQGVWAYRAM